MDEQVSEDETLPPEVAKAIAVQMARLNKNLENQAEILAQSVRRPFWALLIVMALGGIILGRQEMLDNRSEARTCRGTNAARVALVESFETNYQSIRAAVKDDPATLATVERVQDDALRNLRRQLPQLDCG